MSRFHWRLLFPLLVPFVLTCHDSKVDDPLRTFLRQQGYEPFSTINGNYSVGSIIQIKDSHEIIDATPGDCFALPSVLTAPVALPAVSITTHDLHDVTASIVFPRDTASARLAASALAQHASLARISITEGFSSTVPLVRLRAAIDSTYLPRSCGPVFSRPGDHLLLIDVLSAKNVHCTFFRADTSKQAATAAIPALLAVSGSAAHIDSLTGALVVTQPLPLGYRAVRLEQVMSLDGSPTLSATTLTPAQLAGLKQGRRP